jgi:primosomal protein N'
VSLASVYPLVSSRAVARPFTYEVADGVQKGAVVAIRFGRGAARGVVVQTGVEAPPGIATAPVESVLYALPPALVDLALWLADYYGSTPARALELVAPKLRARRG